MTTKVEIKMLNPGNKFVYGNKESIVLDNMEDGVLCMVMDESYKCDFDRDNHNNFAESTLRTKLNADYMKHWIEEEANFRDFVEMEVDLTTDDGLCDYDVCITYLAPRTCEQHRQYRKIIPSINSINDWEWTATACSTKSNGYSSVRAVNSDGSFGYGTANIVTIVRPTFKLKLDTEVEVESSQTVDSDADKTKTSLIDSMQNLVDQYGFPEVMETLAKVIAG